MVNEQYNSIISADKVAANESLINTAIQDLTTAGEAQENAYGDRASLVKKVKQLEGAIQLTEAEAFMRIDEKGFVEVEGKQVKLANAEMRDMYRYHVSRELRKELHEAQAELSSIEIDIYKAKERYDEAKQVSELIIAKAYVQANLFKFLSGRG